MTRKSLAFVALGALIVSIGCGGGGETAKPTAPPVSAAAAAAAAPAGAAPAAAGSASLTGKVAFSDLFNTMLGQGGETTEEQDDPR